MASNDIGWHCATLYTEHHDLRLSLTIRNFLDFEPGQKLESPPMECTQRCGAKWILSVYPFGDSEYLKDLSDYIDVYLKLVDKPLTGQIVKATYVIYVLGSDGSKIEVTGPCTEVEEQLRDDCSFSRGSEYGDVTEVIKVSQILNDKARYLPNGNLTVRCEGKVLLNKTIRTCTTEYLPQTNASNHYCELVKKMYQEGICCDVVLKTGSSEFKCHKAILAATSNYFKAMFGHDMKENRDNVVSVSKDLNEEELKSLLDYVYLGKSEIGNLSSASLQNLYRVSDMYEIYGLQELCETELIKQLNSEDVVDVLNFSVQFGAKRLKKAAAKIIANSYD